MNPNDPNRRAQVASLARQTGFSEDAVASMLDAIVAGGGAQFDHPEFGGAGQWMQGGMLMVSDFDDHALRARVAQLCEALAAWVATDPALAAPASARASQRQSQSSGGVTHVQDSRDASLRWWPASFGTPDAAGAQDGSRYAWFAKARRLVVEHGGRRTIYDTGEHRIAGASQQQGSSSGAHGPVFMSESGPIELDRLRVVGEHDDREHDDPEAAGERGAAGERTAAAATADTPSAVASSDPFHALERLAELHARGIVDAHEFAAKKAELLRRI